MAEFDSETGKAASMRRQELREAEAHRRRKRFAHSVKGAQVRAQAIPGQFLAEIALPTAGLMLAKIINGDLEPKSAKEAADIAKMAVDLHVMANKANLDLGLTAETDTPVDREAAQRTAIALRDDLIARVERMKEAPIDVDEPGPGSDEPDSDSIPDAPAAAVPLRSVGDDEIAS